MIWMFEAPWTALMLPVLVVVACFLAAFVETFEEGRR